MEPTKSILVIAVFIAFVVSVIALIAWLRKKPSNQLYSDAIRQPTPDLMPQYGDGGSVTSTTAGGNNAPDVAENDTGDGADDQDDGTEAEDEEGEPEPERSAAELIAEGDSEAASGDWSTAVESYDAALDKIRAAKGNLSLDLIPVLVKRIDAQTVVESSDWDEETRPTELLLALSISELHNGVFSELNRPLLLALIAFYDRFGVGDKADNLIRRLDQLSATVKFVPIIGHQPSGMPWDEHLANGAVALTRLEYDTAIEHFDEAWNAAEPKVGPYALELAPMVLQCGLAYQARDNQTDDEETVPTDYLTALGIIERNQGPTAMALLTVLTYLVSFYDQLGDHFRADRYLSRLLNALRQGF